jgi:hypothetical protein
MFWDDSGPRRTLTYILDKKPSFMIREITPGNIVLMRDSEEAKKLQAEFDALKNDYRKQEAGKPKK